MSKRNCATNSPSSNATANSSWCCSLIQAQPRLTVALTIEDAQPAYAQPDCPVREVSRYRDLLTWANQGQSPIYCIYSSMRFVQSCPPSQYALFAGTYRKHRPHEVEIPAPSAGHHPQNSEDCKKRNHLFYRRRLRPSIQINPCTAARRVQQQCVGGLTLYTQFRHKLSLTCSAIQILNNEPALRSRPLRRALRCAIAMASLLASATTRAPCRARGKLKFPMPQKRSATTRPRRSPNAQSPLGSAHGS